MDTPEPVNIVSKKTFWTVLSTALLLMLVTITAYCAFLYVLSTNQKLTDVKTSIEHIEETQHSLNEEQLSLTEENNTLLKEKAELTTEFKNEEGFIQ